MPSPRSRFELGCRVGAFAVLGWLLGNSIIPTKTIRVDRVTADNVSRDLPSLTRTAGDVIVHLDATHVPDGWAVDWLSALQHSGRPVTWSGKPTPAAIGTQPAVDPAGGVRIDVAAPASSAIALRDDASPIDSIHVAALGGSVVAPIVVGPIRGSVNGQRFVATTNDSLVLRPVVVVGAAGWEGKYVVSALEERGWPVIARFTVAPNVDVTDGVLANLDTGHVSAVIAIDSTVGSLASAIDRFVRSGGGLVLAGASASTGAIALLAPGNVAPRTHPNVKATDPVRLGTTGFYPVSAMKSDGVALDRRPDGIAMAARRVGSGRVIQVGYDDSWRWRMAGDPGSESAHRLWWTRVVASVAFTPTVPSLGFDAASAAPVASLVDRLGPARNSPISVPSRPIDRRILISLIMILLLTEWASRRLRGLR